MYLNKKQLIERGWSLNLIERFLGEPDDIKPLGKYCEEHRYWLPRIEVFENRSEEFKTAQEKYHQKRDAGKRLARRRADKQIEAARMMPIRIREMPFEDVLVEAIWHFNSRNRGRRYDDEDYYYPLASKNSEEFFLQRIAVNYIRHHLTSYDSSLFAQKGKVGGSEAVPIIRRRVFEEIALAYPNLSDECDRQMLKRGLITESEIENKKKAIYEQLELPF